LKKENKYVYKLEAELKEGNEIKYKDYVEKIEKMLESNSYPQNKWFGFNINTSFAELLYACSIPLYALEYNQNNNLTIKQKKYILKVLIKLCKKTYSRQILYYINIWSNEHNNNEKQCKGYKEFKRTFNFWFKFEKNFF